MLGLASLKQKKKKDKDLNQIKINEKKKYLDKECEKSTFSPFFHAKIFSIFSPTFGKVSCKIYLKRFSGSKESLADMWKKSLREKCV